MRTFRHPDGSIWTAQMHDGDARPDDLLTRVGWEVVVFDCAESSGAQRFVHRTSGWLRGATDAELLAALRESDLIRTVWAPVT
jgi:hypothetical protein